MKYLILALILIHFDSCILLNESRSTAACIQNNSTQAIIIRTSPTFKSRTGGYWEKFQKCYYEEVYDSILDRATRVYDSLKRDCLMDIPDEHIYMKILIHDEAKKYGSYSIDSKTIFDLGASDGRTWPHRKLPLRPSDIIYDTIRILSPTLTMINLYGKDEIYRFVTSSKYSFNKKKDKRLNKGYSKIAIIK